ncbi:hypothetical protein [Hydrocarboniphaga sp.]|uniref:hypothetical protein n=1 Tax=Hydrocarboniphaga sp. TaxID=2033016 RepID=UPI002639A92A|nr:hypothetical protein [Hydrocarboniphaga sp.]
MTRTQLEHLIRASGGQPILGAIPNPLSTLTLTMSMSMSMSMEADTPHPSP